MEKLSIDTLGPFPPDQNGNIYVIVIIDCFSRYVQLCPASDCTADAAAAAILKHFSYFSVPKILLSDNGSQYANQMITALGKLTNMALAKTIAYSHEENGIVERANREILRHIRAILFENMLHKEWSQMCPLVQRIMNATKHSATGYAPASIITPGIDLNEGILFPYTVLPGDTTSLPEYIKLLHDKQAFVVKAVQQRLVSNTPNTNNAMQTNIRLHHFQKTRLFWLAILKGPARQPNYTCPGADLFRSSPMKAQGTHS
jgi:hypothetical protein